MLKKVSPGSLSMNVFEAIGHQWMLITAGNREESNTMTASWGGVGVLWGQPSATAYIRPQRYTKAFVDQEEYFTLSFLPEVYRTALSWCGTNSGRDGDKWSASGLHPAFTESGVPYVAEAELVLVVKKQFCQQMAEECILDAEAKEKHYPQQDYHYMYIGRIVEAYQAR